MLNNVVFTGRIANDVESKTTQSGKTLVNLRIAVKRNFSNGNTNAQGYKEYDTDWINATAWAKNAEFAARLVKGQMIAIQGRLQSENYEDKNHNKRESHRVVIDLIMPLDKKNLEQGGGSGNQGQQSGFGNQQQDGGNFGNNQQQGGGNFGNNQQQGSNPGNNQQQGNNPGNNQQQGGNPGNNQQQGSNPGNNQQGSGFGNQPAGNSFGQQGPALNNQQGGNFNK